MARGDDTPDPTFCYSFFSNFSSGIDSQQYEGVCRFAATAEIFAIKKWNRKKAVNIYNVCDGLLLLLSPILPTGRLVLNGLEEGFLAFKADSMSLNGKMIKCCVFKCNIYLCSTC